MDTIRIIVLGIIQGITEFIPVSSSGHLVLIEQLWQGFSRQDLFIDIILHLGTAMAVIVFTRREIMMIIRGLMSLHRKPSTDEEIRERRLTLAVGASIVPTAFLGILFKTTVIDYFANFIFLGTTFLLTAIFLWYSKKLIGDKREASIQTGFLVGIAQGIAVLPGISRSGATIVAGQALGLDRAVAARFAFVISIPAIFGAAIHGILDGPNLPNFNTSLIFSLFYGTLAAALTGYASLILLVNIIRKARLHLFAYYCVAVSLFCFYLGISG